MLGRRLICFQKNVAKLAAHGRCYLWTFTMREAVAYETTRKAWNRLLTYLKRRLPRWSGMRVYEVHPGRHGEYSHGLHVHVLTNKWFKIDPVLDACRAAGWGRTNVIRIPQGREGYIGKYLSKERPPALKGVRLLGYFGLPERSRLGDFESHGLRADLMRIACNRYKGTPWNVKLAMVENWVWRIAAGEFVGAVWEAWASKHRHWRGKFGGWERADRTEFKNCDLRWGFTARQSRLVVPFFDPFSTCWGSDRLKQDLVRDTAAVRSLMPSPARHATEPACRANFPRKETACFGSGRAATKSQ